MRRDYVDQHCQGNGGAYCSVPLDSEVLENSFQNREELREGEGLEFSIDQQNDDALSRRITL